MEQSKADYESLMPPTRRAQIRRKRETSDSLHSSIASHADSEISVFLDEKVRSVQSDIDLGAAYIAGLDDLKQQSDIDPADLQQAREQKLSECRVLTRELEILRLSSRGLAADTQETLISRRTKSEHDPALETLQEAYSDVLLYRTMACTAKQKKSPFRQTDFHTAVLERYAARDPKVPALWCHLLGEWLEPKQVKAAHLVPKAFSPEELKPLFGCDEGEAFKDPRNGITLHKNIEEALDSGVIVIVPVPTEHDQGVTQWKCLLVDQDLQNQECCRRFISGSSGQPADAQIVKWKELDGKHLTFQTPNRPARRFFYFRFIVTYLFAKVNGNTDFLEKVAVHKTFWGSPGEYVERGTLTAMSKAVSGSELPRSLYHNTTFGPGEETSPHQTDPGTMMVAASISDCFGKMRLGQKHVEDD